MYKIKEAIIVEGTYDKIKLSGFIDAVIVETGGFAIYTNKEKLKMIQKLAQEIGIVIFTDSDSAGFQIRNYIKQNIPQELVKHAYIPDIKGKERRKKEAGKEGLLGVEGIDEEMLLSALLKAGCEIEDMPVKERRQTKITKTDLFRLGLSGGKGSSKKREMLTKELSLPAKISPNMLLKVLEQLLTLEELGEIVQKIDDENKEIL